ncbi:hypothetical protein P280DRAFT_507698 [Massarina eburnea CBS 473.64]|uniref:Uncharacterized protein n=1 Tax=Massarina eburnea CBS 473.64 TaxID=1395130 RepID=A0A6A6RXS2_9PLEO|nr:hypothetical protein P280DRAFT_507698 [Massarina eburnea CBS 473.64]
MFYPTSLNAMKDIASTLSIAKYIHEVVIASTLINPILSTSSRKLNALQREIVECSVHEYLLADIFNRLPNLKTVQVGGDWASLSKKNVKCGQRDIKDAAFKEIGGLGVGCDQIPLCVAYDYRQLGDTRLLGLVLPALETAGVMGKVDVSISTKLDREFHAYKNSVPFDFSADIWTKGVASRLRSVELNDVFSVEKNRGFFRATSRTRNLSVNAQYGQCSFSRNPAHVFYWPNLRNVTLTRLRIDRRSLLGFLARHIDNLVSLSLGSVSWITLRGSLVSNFSLGRKIWAR